jgi:uncharacterized membrane protein
MYHHLTAGAAVIGYVALMLEVLAPDVLPGSVDPYEVGLLIAVTAATLTPSLRRLPGQNVLLAGCVAALVGGIAHLVGAMTAIPFGPFLFTPSAGPLVFGKLAWIVPLIWIVALLNSRDVARLILRPWRKLRARYGIWVLVLSIVVTLAFCAALEPYASRLRHFWLWEPTRLPVTWYGAPITLFMGWAVVSLLILALVTPALINKKASATKSPPDYQPLVIWIALDVLFATGAATQQLWPAVAVCAVCGVAITAAAIRGSRW